MNVSIYMNSWCWLAFCFKYRLVILKHFHFFQNIWRNFQNLWFFSSCFLSFHHHLEWLCSWCKKTIPKLFFLSFPTPIFCQIVSQHFLAGFSLFFLFPRFKLLLALVNPKSCIATNFKFVMEVIIRWILKQHLFYLNQSTNLVSTQMNFLFLA